MNALHACDNHVRSLLCPTHHREYFLSVGGGAVDPGGGSEDARLWATTSAPAENTDGIFSTGAPHSRHAVSGAPCMFCQKANRFEQNSDFKQYSA